MQYPGKPLTVGATGAAVLLVQRELLVQQTGTYGPTTRDLVAQYQRTHGLDADGIVGPATWSRLFAPAHAVYGERVLPVAWLPAGQKPKVKRVILHWTAGQHQPSAFDRAHYHFVIDGQGRALRHPAGVLPGNYLPHCRNMNTHSVGLSLAAMAMAQERGSDGKAPLLRVQWEHAAQAAAEILFAYGLEVKPTTLCTHSEVTTVFGIKQRGKWDIDRLPFEPAWSPAQVHAQLRELAAAHLARLKGR